ncbi:MAG: hypothetical protein OXH11_18310 [Candidatus Aminicenantes bacterium]|nr:hypothetical protein [Candidatus Aminicenantes bacterium]
MPLKRRQRFKATMTENGRLVIPAALRTRLGVAGQRHDIFFEIRGSEVILTTKMRALRRAQERLVGIVSAGSQLISEELIEDRRAEARRESEDGQDRS